MRGATIVTGEMRSNHDISTHAPHARRDEIQRNVFRRVLYFYSRASCEARPHGTIGLCNAFLISTHAPHARRDQTGRMGFRHCNQFLLTRLMRGATHLQTENRSESKFLLTRLMRGATIQVFDLLICR